MIKTLLLLLLGVCMVFSGLSLLIPNYGVSINIGVWLVFLVNSYGILRIFRYSGTGRIARMQASFFTGTMGKLVMSSLGFSLIFHGVFGLETLRKPDHAFALLLSFLCVYLVYIALIAIWPLSK